ncbi:MAG: sn-glycerol-3-phosphate ABC transporter ATP-binding protein UgpC [Proteobacteria bacterium]|nr:sn-glycerol-3-phosphate ABC transporter ATP-binding protein UgpC [Pseudomonadota bacterium]MBI3496643.1 sn-glycerol-3-phosphate ABC transporter ATP-binding protein UgpC [Pseudomonadota bacterium]
MASLVLRQVSKAFGPHEVIHGVDLEVANGELVVFVGPSGCGKSTLLRIIAGLTDATSGDVLLDGTRVNATSAADRGLAMVFQSYALYPHMSVKQNLSFGLENLKVPKTERERRIAEAAHLLQIDSLLGRTPRQLSGGQRQRVAIGRAIVREPRIFLFDEPLSNLDAELRVQMRVEIAGLHARLNATMIYVTHDQVEAMTLASKIVVLRAGRVEQVGAPLELYNRPANKFVAGFIGSPRMNLLEGHATALSEAGVTVAVPGLAPMFLPFMAAGLAPGEPLVLGIRPEHVAEIQDGDGACTPVVDLSEQLGGQSHVHVTLPAGQKLTLHRQGQTELRRGERLAIAFPPGLCHLFRRSDERALMRCP